MVPGAAIGSGLLFQSGEALYKGGPVSLWLGYLSMGTVLYAVLVTSVVDQRDNHVRSRWAK